MINNLGDIISIIIKDNNVYSTLNLMNNNIASSEAETNEVQIDVGDMKDPFESLEYSQKGTSDRSICLLKPNEGNFFHISSSHQLSFSKYKQLNFMPLSNFISITTLFNQRRIIK